MMTFWGNYSLSRRRVYGLLKWLQQNLELLQVYDTIIREQLETGLVEELKVPEVTHYLPHHPSGQRNHQEESSWWCLPVEWPLLNDCLHTGLKFYQSILEILLRFQFYTVFLLLILRRYFDDLCEPKGLWCTKWLLAHWSKVQSKDPRGIAKISVLPSCFYWW